ncbi:MAG: hypothetical protein BAJALOKI1v1_2340001 [Promethearchaeota archaeon]|nr:MAG: hypothetical protein BAJALOKI1v1_2340001 [Candidatus Lokiarchaeota archaeon]
MFEPLETMVISDINERMRRMAALIIIEHFTKKGLNALKWALINTPSLYSVLYILTNCERSPLHSWRGWISQSIYMVYGVDEIFRIIQH